MIMRTLQNNFTMPEQSKRLLELGLPAESADCYYTQEKIEDNVYWFDLHIKREYQPHTSLHASTIWGEILPCWSVGRLIEICLKCSTLEQRQVRFLCNSDRDEYSIIDFTIAVLESGITTNQMDFSKLED